MAAPLLAVDAPSILYRAFYGLPDSIKGAGGQPVNALLGAANLIIQEIQRHEPRAVVACFGAEAAAYRVETHAGYHAARPEMPDDLVPQWEVAGTFFEAFGWSVFQHETLEADDLLGTFSRLEEEAGGRCLLLTGDRDMFQCASERTTVLYLSTGIRGASEVGPEEVRERYGIDPAQVPDFIALRGDPSDGIPGAKGVGEKTAAALLAAHETLEGVLAAANAITKPALRKTLMESGDELAGFKHMATLQDAGIKRAPDQPSDWQRGGQAARGLGMERLAERVEAFT